jgi:hypothetical protein
MIKEIDILDCKVGVSMQEINSLAGHMYNWACEVQVKGGEGENT